MQFVVDIVLILSQLVVVSRLKSFYHLDQSVGLNTNAWLLFFLNSWLSDCLSFDSS